MSCPYSIRTKSIEDCAKFFRDYGGQKCVDWQPGNGTRYALLFVELFGEMAGFDEANSWQITWLSKRKTMFISAASLVHYSYVQEKLECGTSDAICIAEAIGHILGVQSTTCEEFDPALPVRLVMES
jgi:hypothetical protein